MNSLFTFPIKYEIFSRSASTFCKNICQNTILPSKPNFTKKKCRKNLANQQHYNMPVHQHNMIQELWAHNRVLWRVTAKWQVGPCPPQQRLQSHRSQTRPAGPGLAARATTSLWNQQDQGEAGEASELTWIHHVLRWAQG